MKTQMLIKRHSRTITYAAEFGDPLALRLCGLMASASLDLAQFEELGVALREFNSKAHQAKIKDLRVTKARMDFEDLRLVARIDRYVENRLRTKRGVA